MTSTCMNNLASFQTPANFNFVIDGYEDTTGGGKCVFTATSGGKCVFTATSVGKCVFTATSGGKKLKKECTALPRSVRLYQGAK